MAASVTRFNVNRAPEPSSSSDNTGESPSKTTPAIVINDSDEPQSDKTTAESNDSKPVVSFGRSTSQDTGINSVI